MNHLQSIDTNSIHSINNDDGSPSKLSRKRQRQQKGLYSLFNFDSYCNSWYGGAILNQVLDVSTKSKTTRNLLLQMSTILCLFLFSFIYISGTQVIILPNVFDSQLVVSSNVISNDDEMLRLTTADNQSLLTDVKQEPQLSYNTSSGSTGSATTTDNKPIIVSRSNRTYLALLYPPGLLGGYRNQIIRLIAFTVYAKDSNIQHLLLPSLVLTTKLSSDPLSAASYPIPFDWIFDVDYWNTFSEYLPTILPLPDQYLQMRQQQHQEDTMMDCWMTPSELHRHYNVFPLSQDNQTQKASTDSNNIFNYLYNVPNTSNNNIGNDNGTSTTGNKVLVNHLQHAMLQQGIIRPLAYNVTIPLLTNRYPNSDPKFNVRRHNFATDTQHCINPRVYGGGKQSGILWNEYMSYQEKANRLGSTLSLSNSISTSKSKSFVPHDTDVWIYRALRPTKIWRDVADQCITNSTNMKSSNAEDAIKYIALHARIELEMMNHVCGSGMEKNLTNILHQVYDLYNTQTEITQSSFSGLFIAVSRTGMKLSNANRKGPFQLYAEENIRTLNRITDRTKRFHQDNNTNNQQSLLDKIQSQLPAFECGENILKQFYKSHPNIPDHGTLLQSVINFHIAVMADIFIGVEQSSYSTDILTTRYWIGKGLSNYRYTTNGIVEQVENSGLPLPHGNCKNKSPTKKITLGVSNNAA